MTERKGLIIVYTGNGKGKTTASLGLALRALGWGLKILMIQFIKGEEWPSGELKAVKKFKGFEIKRIGQGFVKIRGDQKPFLVHQKAALAGLKAAILAIQSKKYDIIILDEINVAVKEKLLVQNDILNLIKIRPKNLNLVFTGRGAAKKLINKADLVTEMKEVKHPYQKNFLAQRGIDF